jgi:hypothetical protein
MITRASMLLAPRINEAESVIVTTLVAQLGKRLSHILRRLLSIAQYLVERDGLIGLNGHFAFTQRVGKAYNTFIDEVGLIRVVGSRILSVQSSLAMHRQARCMAAMRARTYACILVNAALLLSGSLC